MVGYWVSIAMFSLIGLIQIFIPYMLRSTVVFGVTIPISHIRHATVNQAKRIYCIATSIVWLLMIISYSIWTLSINQNEDLQIVVGVIIMLLFILISLLFYTYFHRKLQIEKRQEQWGEGLTEVKVASTVRNKQDEMLPLSYFLSLIFVSLILIIYTYYQYPLLPQQVPTHWGPGGEPDAFTEKNYFSVISLPLIMLVTQILLAAISEGTKHSGVKISALNMQKSVHNQVKKRKYTSRFMFLTAFLITLLSSFLQLTTIHHGIIGKDFMLTIFISFIVLIFMGSIIFSIKVSKSNKEEVPSNMPNGITDIDDDRYWKGGLVYFNKEDPSLFVEKRFGIGWTINFMRPMSYIIVFGPILIIFFIAYFL
jgi:uncharacterized membrane protein